MIFFILLVIVLLYSVSVGILYSERKVKKAVYHQKLTDDASILFYSLEDNDSYRR